jgi:dTDP-glucose 4,6-dehydratase
MPNIEIVRLICSILDRKSPETARRCGGRHESLITYVTDRLGHDRRYAIDANKIASHLGWKPKETFVTGIEKTVDWYLCHIDWVANIASRSVK